MSNCNFSRESLYGLRVQRRQDDGSVLSTKPDPEDAFVWPNGSAASGGMATDERQELVEEIPVAHQLKPGSVFTDGDVSVTIYNPAPKISGGSQVWARAARTTGGHPRVAQSSDKRRTSYRKLVPVCAPLSPTLNNRNAVRRTKEITETCDVGAIPGRKP